MRGCSRVVLVTLMVACLVATAVGEEEYEVPEVDAGSAAASAGGPEEPEPLASIVDDGFNNVEDLPAGDDTTRMRCQLFGAWGDFCEYRNLCFDTSVSSLLFTVPDDSPRLKAKVLQSSTGIRFTTKLPLFDPSPHRKVPALFVASHKYVPQSVMDSRNPRWVDDPKGALYIAAYQDKLSNIWYYSSRIFPLFVANYYRQMLRLPKIGSVLIPMDNKKVTKKWHMGAMNITLDDPLHTPVYYNRMNPFNNFAPVDGRPWCVRRVVITGAQVYGFPDFVTALEYRRRAYAYVGLPPPPLQQLHARDTPRMITILDRPRIKPRHIHNIAAMLAVIKKYDMPYQHIIVEDETEFEEQVKLFATTGVLITVHGAGLMNQIFMPPGSVTIEVFPNHVKHVLYERVAHYAGVYHFKVFSKDHTARFSELHQDYYNNKCDDVLSIQIAEKYGGVCWRIIKNVPVVVPIPEFEVALVEGLDHFRRTVYKPNA